MTAQYRTDLFEQVHSGKISLMTLVENLRNEQSLILPELIFDKQNRYVKMNLNDNDIHKENLFKISMKQNDREKDSIGHIIQQQSIFVSSSSSSLGKQTSQLSTEEIFTCIADKFQLSSNDIEQQYKLALKNRIEIPPILMRRIIIDAIRILRIMIDEIEPDIEQHDRKFQQISKRLIELETYDKLFDRHC